MSWLFGVIGTDAHQNNRERFDAIHGQCLHQRMTSGQYYFAAGGNRRTCYASSDRPDESFWMGLGMLVTRNGSHSILNRYHDWETLAAQSTLASQHNGHFVFLSYKNGVVEIRTDPIGLRTLYWCRQGNQIIISTRLDWICAYTGGGEIDHRHLGGRWLLFNQLTFDAPVKNIRRLGPGGVLTIEHNIIHERITQFTPVSYSSTGSSQDIVDLLSAFATPAADAGQTISLGLSGGLDSRTLLAIMRSRSDEPFQTHTIGPLRDPDVFIPRTMALKENIPHQLFDTPFSEITVDLSSMQSYAAETNLIEPVSTAVKLTLLNTMAGENTLLIDGAFGEIARRQYLNRIEIHGARQFRDRNIELIMKNLSVPRGNFFNEDVQRTMEEGAREEIAWMIDTMPDISEIGGDNYLDLWSIRSRLSNYNCDEQARLDRVITNYMPFVQYDFAQSVFTLPLSERRNARLFRQIIRSLSPSLTRYPLVKSSTTYPFAMPKMASLLYTKIKSAMGYRYFEDHLNPFLARIKSDVFDTMQSQSVRNNSSYDHDQLRSMIEGYYRGDISQRNNLLWWLTYELWRRSIEQK